MRDRLDKDGYAQFKTKYTRFLTEELLPSINDPKEILYESIRRRGFLFDLKKGPLLLDAGSHPDDLEKLNELLPVPIDQIATATFQPTQLEALDIGAKIILEPSWRGFSAIEGDIRHPTILEFKNTRFGIKAPALHLDCGIAPLVKRLPFISVLTILCCDGHGHEYPYIEFGSRWDIELFLAVIKLPEVAALSKKLEFKAGRLGEHSLALTLKEEDSKGSPSRDMVDLCDALYHLARGLESFTLRKSALEIKKRIVEKYSSETK